VSGGQFSLVRIVFGAGLALAFTLSLKREVDLAFVLQCAAILASVAFVLGAGIRVAAVVLATAVVLLAVTAGSLDWSGLGTLLALAPFLLAPDGPYLSWRARGQVDPRGTGPMSPTQRRTVRYAAAILLMFGAVSFGNTVLGADPTEIRMAWARLLDDGWIDLAWREWSDRTLRVVSWMGVSLFFVTACRLVGGGPPRSLWIATFAALLVVGLFAGFTDVLGALTIMLLVFEPDWLPPRRDGDEPALVFYDGHCGLCHRTVRMLLAEDPTGDTFRFAPLQGSTFPERVSERGELPDSVLVLTPDGRLLVRSAAAIEALWRLGGFWRALGHALWLVPLPLRDLGYAAVARVRKAIFGAPEATCPIIPADLGQRFLP
jgi:predicted DCC family thiol-disulfide oxidoreductase YuxK